MIKEELIGEGMCKGLSHTDAGGEDAGHQQSHESTQNTGGVHKGEDDIPEIAFICKAGKEDEDYLYGAQVQRHMRHLYVKIHPCAVSRGHHLHHAECLDELGEYAHHAAHIQHAVEVRFLSLQPEHCSRDQHGTYTQPYEMIQGKHFNVLLIGILIIIFTLAVTFGLINYEPKKKTNSKFLNHFFSSHPDFFI